jgi:hypothetical protein
MSFSFEKSIQRRLGDGCGESARSVPLRLARGSANPTRSAKSSAGRPALVASSSVRYSFVKRPRESDARVSASLIVFIRSVPSTLVPKSIARLGDLFSENFSATSSQLSLSQRVKVADHNATFAEFE